jgi:hypothetical protein
MMVCTEDELRVVKLPYNPRGLRGRTRRGERVILLEGVEKDGVLYIDMRRGEGNGVADQ